MKKTGILNSNIANVVSRMGHTDMLCIADAGLPIPETTKRIDLAVSPGIPSFSQVIDSVLEELKVEEIILAEEIKKANPKIHSLLTERFSDIQISYISHTDFKERTALAKAVIRTGECSPYANVILCSGVTF